MLADPEHVELLKKAANEGAEAEVRRLVDAGVDINHGHRPSFLGAYFNGHVEIVRYLLSSGGDVNHNGHSEVTLLMAAINQEDLEFAAYLVEVGADVNLRLPRGGETALHKAAVNNRTRSVQFLITNGAEVDLPAKVGGLSEMPVFSHLHGETALHIAAVRSDAELIDLLLQAGADPLLQTSKGQTPLDLARESGRAAEVIDRLQTESGS